MMPRAKITGTGMCVPTRLVTNDDLAKLMDTSDEWIRQRSGIVTRYYVEPGQKPSELAQDARKEHELDRLRRFLAAVRAALDPNPSPEQRFRLQRAAEERQNRAP